MNEFSILIPTWNNLAYLKCCIESLRNNSGYHHKIIVMINEGSDGTLEWVANQPDLVYFASQNNIGICYGLNVCRPLIAKPLVLYVNDDMYFLLEWDKCLSEAIGQILNENFMISATMIEPKGENPCRIIADFGESLQNFNEAALLKAAVNLKREDWPGSTWPPVLVLLKLWDKVGGMSIEFSPGMYFDPDLSYKLRLCGVRYFRGVGSSLVYHFGCKSTKRIKHNAGRNTFLRKWGVSANQFMYGYLNVGEKYISVLPEVKTSDWNTIL